MSRRFLFILRGRPGLGHVIPGYALARTLAASGHVVEIVTYRNGTSFLSESRWSNHTDIPMPASYRDWPGLDLYDDGIAHVLPAIEQFGPDVIVLGGEYVLPPLLESKGAAVGAIYNAEIFVASERNRTTADLFATLLGRCDFLIPLRRLESAPTLGVAAGLEERTLAHGPFLPWGEAATGHRRPAKSGLLVLVANGGGVDFPSTARSYSSRPVDTRSWVEATVEMTAASVQAAVKHCRHGDEIVAFSCLSPNANARIAAAAHGAVAVEAPSSRYYDLLRHADVIISRAGAGFIADAELIDGHVILWCLDGHDEQAMNAAALEHDRKGTVVCAGVESLEHAVEHALATTRDSAPPHDSTAARAAARARTGRAAQRLARVTPRRRSPEASS